MVIGCLGSLPAELGGKCSREQTGDMLTRRCYWAPTRYTANYLRDVQPSFNTALLLELFDLVIMQHWEGIFDACVQILMLSFVCMCILVQGYIREALKT